MAESNKISIDISAAINTAFDAAVNSALNKINDVPPVLQGVSQSAKKNAESSWNAFQSAFNRIKAESDKVVFQIQSGHTRIFQSAGKSAKDSASVFNTYFEQLKSNTVVSTETVQKAISRISETSKRSARESAQVFIEYFNEIEKKSQITFQKTQDAINKTLNIGNKSYSARDSFSTFTDSGFFAVEDRKLKEQKQLLEQRQAALSTLAHSLPFGAGRALAFTTLNFGNVSEDAENASATVQTLSATISRIPVPVILGVAAAFKAVTSTVEFAKNAVHEFIIPLLQTGIAYNDLIENTRYGMAGLIFQLTEIKLGQELVTSATERWTGSLEIADQINEELQAAALKTKVVYSDLSRGMQEGLAPMLQMWIKQGEITPFVARFVQAMTTLRVPLREIGQEIRAFSNLETNPRTARVSFAVISQAAKQMGVDVKTAKERLQELKEQGKLDDWFMENTKGMEIASADIMKTVSGQYSNFQELKERLLGLGTKELYEELRGSIESVINEMVSFDAQGKATFSPGLLLAIRTTATVFEGLLKVVNLLASAAIRMANAFAEIPNIPKNLKKVSQSFPGIMIAGKWVPNPLYDPAGYLEDNPSVPKGAQRKGYYFLNDLIAGQDEENSENKKADRDLFGNAFSKLLKLGNPRLRGGQDENITFEDWLEKVNKDTEKGIKDLESAREKAIEAQQKFFDEWASKTEGLRKSFLEKGVERFTGMLNAYNIRQRGASVNQDWSTGGIYANQFPLLSGTSLLDSWNAGAARSTGFLAEYNIERERERTEKNADTFNQAIETYWRGPMRLIFAELGTTGGENFMQVMASNFDQMVSTSIENIVNTLIGGDLSANPIKDDKGNIVGYNYSRNGQVISGAEYERLNRNQSRMNIGMTGINVGLGSYSAGRTGAAGSVTGGAIGGAASVGGAMLASPFAAYAWVGAIVGAIVGGLAAAAGKAAARDEYKWARPYVSKTGQADLYVNRNIGDAEEEEMRTRLQETLDRFWNGYMQLAVKYASNLIPKLSDISGWFDIQPEASKNFLKHWDEFINGEFPDKIAEFFKPALTQIAVSLGMDAAKFEQIYQKFDNLDPSKALELFNLLFEALSNFQKVSRMTWETTAMPTEQYFNRMVEGHGISNRQQSYASTFAEEQDRLSKLAASIGDLTNESQVRAAHELSTALVDMMERQNQLARQFALFLQDSVRSFDQMRRTYTLEGMGTIGTDEEGNKVFNPDYEAQYNYLQDYLQTIMNNISTAGTLEELQYWQGEAFSTFQQMGSIASQGGPEMAAAFRVWLLGEDGKSGVLGLFQTTIASRVGQWGDDIATQTNAFMQKMQPAIDAFNTKIDEVVNGTPTGGSGKGAGGLGGFGKEIEEVIPDIVTFGNELSRVNNILKGIGTFSDDSGEGLELNSFNDPDYETRVISRRSA